MEASKKGDNSHYDCFINYGSTTETRFNLQTWRFRVISKVTLVPRCCSWTDGRVVILVPSQPGRSVLMLLLGTLLEKLSSSER